MAYTVLIPARLASTRLPNKPLADIGGVPMVVRVAQRVRAGRAQLVFLYPHRELQIVDAKHVRRLLFLQSRFILL